MSNNLLSNFQEAYRNLTFLPLIEDSSQQNSKVLLSGHRGCGKSTLLAEFKRKLDATYFVTKK